jgi:outer membrane protein TolC
MIYMRMAVRFFIFCSAFFYGVTTFALHASPYELTATDIPKPLPQSWDNKQVGVYLPSALNPAGLPLPQRLEIPHKKLTLMDALALVLRRNPDVVSAEMQRVSDKYAWEIAREKYQPKLEGVNLTAHKDIGKKTNYSISPSVKWSNQLGTTVTFNYSPGLQSGQKAFGDVKITQPLLKGFNMPHLDYMVAQGNEEQARYNFKEAIHNVVVQVIQSYMQLLQNERNQLNQQASLKQQKMQLDQAKQRLDAGKISELDYKQQESSYLTSQMSLQQERVSVENNREDFLQMIGLPPDVKNIDIDLQWNVQNYFSSTPKEQESVEFALSHNVDYLLKKLSLRSDQRAVEKARDQLRWGLDFTYDHQIGSAPIPLSGSGDTPTDSYAELTLDIPVDNLSDKSTLASARVSYEIDKLRFREKKQSLIRLIAKDFQKILSDTQELELARKNTELKKDILNKVEEEYGFGRTTSFEVASLRQQLIEQQQVYVASQMKYFLDRNQLFLDRGDLLSKWHLKLRY